MPAHAEPRDVTTCRSPNPLAWTAAVRTRTQLGDYLSRVRTHQIRDDAHGCVPVLLPLRRLWHRFEAEARRLLRVLLIRVSAVPADTSKRRLPR
jgi:hypothetical protein